MRDEVTLRAVRAEDLPILFAQQLDPEATAMAAFPSRDREAFMAHWQRILADPALFAYAIVRDGAVLGNIVAFDRDGERQIGYWIGREHWGKGVATAALRRFLAVETRRPLHAHVALHNVGSLRVLEKCGFVREREEMATLHGVTLEERVMVLHA